MDLIHIATGRDHNSGTLAEIEVAEDQAMLAKFCFLTIHEAKFEGSFPEQLL